MPQPTVLDQAMFDPSYEGYDFQSVAHVPTLGLSAHWAMVFVVGHAVWSISIPIAVVESLVPGRRTTPWLGNPGLAVTGAVFALGSWIILQDHRQTEQFATAPAQLAGSLAVTAALVALAFAIPRRPPAAGGRRAPEPWRVAAFTALAANVFFAPPESWLGVAIGAATLAVTAVVVARWSGRPGWDQRHRLAVAGGALTAHLWAGFLLLHLEDAATPVNLLGQALLVLGAVVLLVAAGRAAKLYQART